MPTLKTINKETKYLIKEAQDLLQSASSATGDKADELRTRGMKLLDSALVSAHEMSNDAMIKGKEMAESTDEYVKENPWRIIAGVAGAALVLGYILNRKS